MAFKMKRPVFQDKHKLTEAVQAGASAAASEKVTPKKEMTIAQKLKRFETLEKMKNRTPAQTAEMKKLGRELDEYYQDDNRG